MIEYHPINQKVRQLTGSRKKIFRLVTSNTVQPVSGWDGGSREYHSLHGIKASYELPTLILGDRFRNPAVSQELPTGVFMITTSVFYGKPGVPTITCREYDLPLVKSYLEIP